MKPTARAGGHAFAAPNSKHLLRPRSWAAKACHPAGLAALAVAALIAAASPAHAQSDAQKFLQGTHAFRYALDQLGFQPLKSLDELKDDPEHSILVVFGDTKTLGGDKWPGRFVTDGGGLLVATDREMALPQFGVQIYPQPVLTAPGSGHAYHQFLECPIVQACDGDGPPLFENLGHGVATNRTGFIGPWGEWLVPALPPLAVFPDGCRWRDQIRPQIFAVGGPWGNGRVVILADHSVFINNMMLQDDTGNYEFTRNCLIWLSEGRERRDKVLFVDEGTIISDFKVPLTDRPMPDLPEIRDPVGFVDELIPALEKHDFFNRKLMEHVSPDSVFRGLAVVLTLGLLAYGGSRLVRARHRIELAAPLLAPTLTRLVPAGPGVGDRQKALLAEGNLWELAQALAREFFDRALGGQAANTALPPLKVTAGWLRARALRQQVERLWRLAFGAPVRVSAAAFARLVAEVEQLNAAAANGTLQFPSAGRKPPE